MAIKRKIQRLNTGTFVVSIPRHIALSTSMFRGETVWIETKGRQIIIKRSKRR